jgi:hypothetical protein
LLVRSVALNGSAFRWPPVRRVRRTNAWRFGG